jgi:chromosome segregation ATPase
VEQKVGEKEQLDTSLHGQIKELESEKKKVEFAMHDVKEYYEKCQQSFEKIKSAVRDVNEGLEEQRETNNRTIQELKATVRSRDNVIQRITSNACMREQSAFRLIKKMEKQIQDSEKVQVDLRDQIEELNKKLQDAKSEQKQVKSTLCSKAMKLAVATAAVGAVVVGCWYLL